MSAGTLEIISQLHSRWFHLSPRFSCLKGRGVSALTFQVYDTVLNFPSEVSHFLTPTLFDYSEHDT